MVVPGYIMKALGKGDWIASLSDLSSPEEAAAVIYVLNWRLVEPQGLCELDIIHEWHVVYEVHFLASELYFP